MVADQCQFSCQQKVSSGFVPEKENVREQRQAYPAKERRDEASVKARGFGSV